jgi:hypothetical protein
MEVNEMRLFKFLAVLGVSAGVLALTGCTSRAVGRPSGFRLIVFLDQTASIDAAQRAAWLSEATGLTRQLGGGASVAIYPIHDRTMDAAPLFQADIPEMKDDATSDDARTQHLALVRARDGARAAIEKGLNAGPAARTDIFSSIDRIQPDPLRRPTIIVYFSDMLNSTPDLNMEAPGALKRQDISLKLQGLARRHYWRPNQLAGDQVYCILNSIESGHRGPAVDRLTQRAFYGALFQALGAHLAVYETHLPGLALNSEVPGGSNVASN